MRPNALSPGTAEARSATLLVTVVLGFVAFQLLGAIRPAPAAGVDRGILRVEFLYAIEYAGGRSEKLKDPFDIYYDRTKGELYIAEPGQNKVLLYDANGMYVQSFPITGQEDTSNMVAVDGGGRIYVGHARSSVVTLLDYKGESLDLLQIPGTVDVPGAAIRPLYLAGGKGGEVYALKSAGGIVKIDPSGERHEEIRIEGADAPNRIYGFAVDGAGRFLFADMRPYSVVIFDPRNKSFRRFGTPGELYGQLDRPSGVATDDAGHIFVVSSMTGKVSCFDADGNFIEEFGRFGNGYGQFYMPGKIVSDGKDRLFVLENMLKRVQVFKIEFLKEKEVVEGAKTAQLENREGRSISQSTPNSPLKRANPE